MSVCCMLYIVVCRPLPMPFMLRPLIDQTSVTFSLPRPFSGHLPDAGFNKVGISVIRDTGNSHFSQRKQKYGNYVNFFQKRYFDIKSFVPEKHTSKLKDQVYLFIPMYGVKENLSRTCFRGMGSFFFGFCNTIFCRHLQ